MKEIVRKVVNWWNGCSEEEALKSKANYEEAARRLTYGPDKPTEAKKPDDKGK